MAKYKIEVKRSAEKELKKIPKKELIKIIDQIGSLANNPDPRGAKSLQIRKNTEYELVITESYITSRMKSSLFS